MENLEPKREERSPISSLKFQRKSDYKKFRNFIKKETNELKGIEEPKDNQLKSILKVGAGGLGFLALGGIIGAIKGKDNEDTSGKFKTPFIIGRRNPSDSPDLDKLSLFDKPTKLTPEISNFSKIPKPVKTPADTGSIEYGTYKYKNEERVKTSKINNEKVSEVGGDSINKTKTATDTKSRGRYNKNYGPGGKTPPSSPPNKFDDPEFRKDYDNLSGKEKEEYKKIEDEIKKERTSRELAKEYAKKTGQIQVPRTKVEFIGDDVFFDTGKGKIKLDVLTFKGKDYYFIDARASSFIQNAKRADKIRQKILFDDRFTVDDTTGKITYNPSKTMDKSNISKRLSQLKSKGSKIFDSISKTTQNLTPQFLKSDLVKPLFKSKTKTGFFVLDLLFAGQAFADLFKPKDNIRTSVVDLFNAINNQIYQDDPSKLKYYISESSDERIRAYQIKQNQKIRLLKEQAGVDLGGPQNILIIPENKQNNQVSTNTLIKKGETKISFVPFEPVNSVGTDILLHKLNA